MGWLNGLGKELKAGTAPGNELLGMTGAERPPSPNQERRLEYGSLAGTVGPVDKIQPGSEIQRRLLQAAQSSDFQGCQAHWRMRLTAAWA